ncbi:UpxY family transcription antiterminator [Fulvivirga sp. M361]|uniref:UpxY family transcription antiterminator n=1 Tax=Fulvivirga sp. M361 TaxID=2594266 RepID=UPI00117A6144|nr:UpxY family transcription antiterminator [Fulvivirga sp. M361]TRX47250.1 UpxY family transcription antiterminator [Fulvivirga sp. M361]
MITEPKWNVVYTYPNAEKQLHIRLLDKGVESYLPLYKEVRHLSNRKRILEVPLFTSYLFTKVNNVTIDKVRFSKGFASFIQFEGKYATIPDEHIQTIQIIMENNIPYALCTDSSAKSGDYVEITTGALKGKRGYVTHTKGNFHVLMEIDHTGYALGVEIDRRCISVLKTKSTLS